MPYFTKKPVQIEARSPAAQAVLDAFLDCPVDANNYYATRGKQIAAALRAAADQCADGVTHWELYAIAAELEGANG